ncbi:MAG TPA: paraquat-inducible protein A [Steroidobacteraceae bacterium]|nr:paraquat-inducible protein A [Steroidobacteraceae bacterium]
MSQRIVTAGSLGLITCRVCGLLSRAEDTIHELRCPRCAGALQVRKPHSLQRTLALLLAAAILYVPANVLPIMHTSTVVYDGDDTIMSGVATLWSGGSWPLAVLVFMASIVVPTLKIISLSLLVVSTHRGWEWRVHERAILYRMIELIGRWSMLDVFVVALLVALVQLRGVATIHAGAGAMAFAAVVVLTMYAAQAFDPRLIWDRVRT